MMASTCCAGVAQTVGNGPPTGEQEQLKYVAIVSRHGVRSPTGKIDQLNQFARQPWPVWSVPPGYLTEHGARLMTLFGAYDRELFASQGLLSSHGCADQAHIRILADSDQRTRETGKALAAGLAPGCTLPVAALTENTPDPLFHSLEAGVGHPDKSLATASVAGRIGANPQELVEAYRLQLQRMEDVLLGCNSGETCATTKRPASLFDLPATIAPGKYDHLVDLRTPLGTASTMAENMLLEYAEGMDAAHVGWGRVDLSQLRDLMQIHAINADITQRAEYVARAQSSNLLYHLLQSMRQAQGKHPVDGSLTRPDDRLLILVGHDTNIAAISGALHLSWVIDGRRDDTPPGGALVFELWHQNSSDKYVVRVYYTAQTLEQMHNATPLSLAQRPQRVALFVPGCSQADASCQWNDFTRTMEAATDSDLVK
jgi:4-phytase/acid phosphatase